MGQITIKIPNAGKWDKLLDRVKLVHPQLATEGATDKAILRAAIQRYLSRVNNQGKELEAAAAAQPEDLGFEEVE
jgi:hypothetical protein